MSMHPRTSLRKAVVHALTGQLHGVTVYDSKMDPYQGHEGQQDLPAISVYSDDSVIGTMTQANTFSGASWLFEINLELAVSNNALEVETTAQLEEQLDKLEWDVLQLLFEPIGNDVALQFGKTYHKLHDVRSLRIGHSQANDRLAMRGIMLSLEVNARCKDYSEVFPPLETVGLTFGNGDESTPAPITDMQA